ncbi:uncharacterized protein LOC105447186 [Strongylocentrotus purpuratus]|uniref:Uncharacterized protein n=1 Tax=Strongylocentrotus purpuratus TaxID=7668 RepID=A0A7M7HQI0_STRPU|nr:uncharacterized protein LOC105447186 [Strongylocentrotus purpuratus]
MEMQQYPPQQIPPKPYYGQPQEATQQYVYVQPQPHQQQGCCSGYSEHYNIKAGRATGIVQLLLGFTITFVNVLSFVYGHTGYPNQGSPIGIAILFVIPSGIIGITTQSRRSCLIIAYLVMSIFANIIGFIGVVNEGLVAGLFSYKLVCFSYFCYWDSFDVAVILHSVCAALLFIESVVAIVASVYCCRGLVCCRGCCCHSGDGNSTTTPAAMSTAVYYQHADGTVVPTVVNTQPANPV